MLEKLGNATVAVSDLCIILPDRNPEDLRGKPAGGSMAPRLNVVEVDQRKLDAVTNLLSLGAISHFRDWLSLHRRINRWWTMKKSSLSSRLQLLWAATNISLVLPIKKTHAHTHTQSNGLVKEPSCVSPALAADVAACY